MTARPGVTRPAVILLFAVVIGVAPLTVEGQQAGKVYRIGDLREDSAPPSKPFLDAMRELGWVEGQTLGLTIPQSLLVRADEIIQ